MSTVQTITQHTHQNTVATFRGPRIDDLFFGVEKIDDGNCTCYYITVTPQYGGAAHATVKSIDTLFKWRKGQ
jgi:hypothetical protein